MLRIEGSYTFDAPKDVVWEALLDPDVLAKALPGTEKLERTAENEFRGVMNIRVGPVQGRFQGTVVLSDIRPLEGYRLKITGRGAPGFVNGEGEMHLEEQDGKTIMHYGGDAQLGGRIANVGQRLLDSTARSLTRQALEALEAQINARQHAEVTGEPVAVVAPPSTVKVAAAVARDVAADLIPPEQRPYVVAGAVALVVTLVVLLIGRLCRR